MQGMVPRYLSETIMTRVQHNPVVAILGPRQSDKTTLAAQIVKNLTPAVYLDLESPADLTKLDDPLAFEGGPK